MQGPVVAQRVESDVSNLMLDSLVTPRGVHLESRKTLKLVFGFLKMKKAARRRLRSRNDYPGTSDYTAPGLPAMSTIAGSNLASLRTKSAWASMTASISL